MEEGAAVRILRAINTNVLWLGGMALIQIALLGLILWRLW